MGDTMHEEHFHNWMTLYFKKLDHARFVDTMRRMVDLNERHVGSSLFDPAVLEATNALYLAVDEDQSGKIS